MTRVRVYLLPRARDEYALALAWWRSNRTAARDLLKIEVRSAIRLLSEQPEAGPEDDALRGVRRLFLRRCGYHLYYRVHVEQRRVDVLALWHARRLPPEIE